MAIVRAGPVGLDVALAARAAGHDPVVFEAASSAADRVLDPVAAELGVRTGARVVAADGTERAEQGRGHRQPGAWLLVLGAKSYGRNSQFLLRTGWAQVDTVFGAHLRATAPATALPSPMAPTISA